MKAYLCHPSADVTSIYPMLGIGILSGELKRLGHDVKVRDGSAPYFPGDETTLIEDILLFNPDIVGVATFTGTIFEAYRLIKSLRSFGFTGWLVARGPHASSLYQEALSNGFDFVVLDEAEESFPALVNALERGNDPYSLNGIAFKRNGNFVANPLLPHINDLDRFYPLDLDIFRRDDYIRLPSEIDYYGLLISSRGCPGRCTFCARTHMGQKLRQLKPETIFNEIKYRYEKYGVRHFLIFDDMFFINIKKIYELCDLLDGAFPEKIRIHARSRVDRGDRNLLRRMKSVGFSILSYGVESANEEILRRIKKQITIPQAKQTIKTAIELGFEVHVNMMMGFEQETVESIRDNINFVTYLGEIGVRHIPQATTVWPLPGSELFQGYMEKIEKNNMLPWWLDKNMHSKKPRPSYTSIVADMRITKDSMDFYGVYRNPKVLREAQCYLSVLNNIHHSRENRFLKNNFLLKIFVYVFRAIYAVSPRLEKALIYGIKKEWSKIIKKGVSTSLSL